MSRKKSKKARKQHLHSSPTRPAAAARRGASAMPAAEVQNEEISSSGVASSIRPRSTDSPAGDELAVEAVTPPPASDPMGSSESRSLPPLSSVSAVESIAPVEVPVTGSTESERQTSRESVPTAAPPERSTRESASIRRLPTAADNVTPPPPSESLEFDDFFTGHRVSAAPIEPASPEEELDAPPVATAAQLARRAELRRFVTRIVGSLAVASALIFAKELLFPPASLDEVAAQLPLPASLTSAPKKQVENAEKAHDVSESQSVVPRALAVAAEDVPPPPEMADLLDEPEIEPAETVEQSVPAKVSKELASSQPARAGKQKVARADKPDAPKATRATVKTVAKPAGKASSSPRAALPERRAARTTPARPRPEAPASAPALPTSAGFPVAQ